LGHVGCNQSAFEGFAVAKELKAKVMKAWLEIGANKIN